MSSNSKSTKLLTLILFLTVALVSEGQSTSSDTFQVIEARNVFNRKNVAIERLDYLSKVELIELKNGSIYMVHSNGYPLTFHGDTTLSIANLLEDPIFSESMPDNRIKVPYFFRDTPFNEASNPGVIRLKLLKILPSHSIVHNANDPLCLLVDKDVGKLVYFKDMFDDIIAKRKVRSGKLKVSSKDLMKYSQNQKFILLEIPIGEAKERDIVPLKLVHNSSYSDLLSCMMTDPLKAIVIAYYYENQENFRQAAKYYNQAVELSPDKFFLEILTHYQNRRE